MPTKTDLNRHSIRLLMGVGLPVVALLLISMSITAPVSVPVTESESLIAIPDTAITNLFKRECASCHGKDGRGKTRAGRRAGSKDFTDPEYQAAFSDEEAVEVIKSATKNGEELKNKKPFADKLTEEQILALVAHIRTFAED